jgi:glycosyltransferase involved in cell wall biosynthesis
MTQRILFLTPQLPYPLHQGAAIRNFGLIEGLAQRGHHITLLTFIEPGQPAHGDTPLARLCEQIIPLPTPSRTARQRLLDLVWGHADMARRLWSQTFLDAFRSLLEWQSFDVIHFESIEMAGYVRPVWPWILEHAPGTLLVYDAHNAEADLQRRIAGQDIRDPRRLPLALYSFIQAGRLEHFESLIALTVDHVLACSSADAAKLAGFGHPTPITVIPNAIDTTRYHPGGQPEPSVIRPSLVFTGKMDFRPNVDAVLWFAEEVLPLIQRAAPGVHLTVVGQKPHSRLDVLRRNPAITLTGWVDDIQPYILAADVYVVPLRMGSGTRLKLLEAMALERAIVSTRLGAEGLDVHHDEHLLLADSPEEFAGAAITLLRDQTRRAALGASAASLARATHDWAVIIPALEAIYSGARPRA